MIYTIVHYTATSRDNTSFQAILADHMQRYGRLYYNDYIEPNSYFPVHNEFNYRGPDLWSKDIVCTGTTGEEQTAYQLQQLDRLIIKYGYPVLGHSQAAQNGLHATKSACPGVYLLNHISMSLKLRILVQGDVPPEVNLDLVVNFFDKKIEFLTEGDYHMRLTFQPVYMDGGMRSGSADTPTLKEKDGVWDISVYTSSVENPGATYEQIIEAEILHILWYKDNLGDIHAEGHSNTSNEDVYDIWKKLGVSINGNIELHTDMLTRKQVEQIYVLFGLGLGDTQAIKYWTGKPLGMLLASRINDLKAEVDKII